MRFTIICAVVFCLLIIFSQVAGKEKPAIESTPPPAIESIEGDEGFDFWMSVKLKESQRLFAALAQADFPVLVESSQRLKAVSALELFVRRQTPGYATQLKNFEFSVDEILFQASKENIEGVTLGFQQLTLSCVNCHKQLRQ